MTPWMAKGAWLGKPGCPLIMGILNVTPDSFSDGGEFSTADLAFVQAQTMIAGGADILDVGGESTRPGARPVSFAEEFARVIPVVERLVASGTVPISVDTTKPGIARAAIAAGAAIINDIRGLVDDEMRQVVAESDVGVVLMHIQGSPATMQANPHYHDVVGEVVAHLSAQVAAAESAGVGRQRIAVDPGIGFGKSFEHNLDLLRHLDRFQDIGCAILVGTSRKGFLGKITGRPVDERQAASLASALGGAARGASIVRVHDVAQTRDAFLVWQAQHGWN